MSLAVAYGMKKKAKKMADGGMASNSMSGDPEAAEYEQVEDGDDMTMNDGDLVGRVMKARAFSKGGQVANDTKAVTPDDESADYDDLVQRDDLEFSYTGANSGDEIGNEQEDSDRDDIVARVMRARKRRP